MIRPCTDADLPAIENIVNQAATKYHGAIPDDCWHEPYMDRAELLHEIADGVRFWGWDDGGALLGVMGTQDVKDVTLIRHAYVRPEAQGRGVGRALINHLISLTARPVLVGTWAAAVWAIRFYQGQGFTLVTPEAEKDRLLDRYWKISPRQRETSVVLARR
jgi:GNAT superfamily N-acetyltransferase